jgi:hypothetical protein
MCVVSVRMYSNLTSDINLYHIQSTSCSKSGRTTLRLIVLEGLKNGGSKKLRLPIVTGSNSFVRSQGIATKMHPHFLTVVILRIHIFWGVMLCLCMIHSKIFEGKKIFRTAGRQSSNKTKSQNWRPKSLECSLHLHFILPVTFSDFVLTFCIWVNCREIIFLKYDLIISVNNYFPLLLHSSICSSWHCFTLRSAKFCGLR